jgi:hypothetical protein
MIPTYDYSVKFENPTFLYILKGIQAGNKVERYSVWSATSFPTIMMHVYIHDVAEYVV